MAILSITYEFGSGAEEIGHAIEKEMGYDYLSIRKILEGASQSGKKWERYSADYGEAMPNIWERYDWSFLGFMAIAQGVILDHAVKNNVVIMARGAYYLLRGIPHVLGVRVVAPREQRVARIMAKENVSRDTAEMLVKRGDQDIASFIRQLYGRKWDDPDAYEIKVDTGTQSIPQIVDTVKSLLAAKDNLKTPEAQNQLELRALAAKIKAHVFSNPDFLIPTLEVEAGQEGITLRGIARSIKEHQAIDEEVRKLRGGVPVRCEIHYRGVTSVKPHRV